MEETAGVWKLGLPQTMRGGPSKTQRGDQCHKLKGLQTLSSEGPGDQESGVQIALKPCL